MNYVSLKMNVLDDIDIQLSCYSVLLARVFASKVLPLRLNYRFDVLILEINNILAILEKSGW